MIRRATVADWEQMITIWLEASCIAHGFISRTFWEGKVEDMRNLYLPSATNWVYVEEESDKVIGFISIAGEYIPALFVDPSRQKRGIGRALLAHVKDGADSLALNVYAGNKGAVLFYQKQGFVIVNEAIEKHTGHKELRMSYGR